MSFSPDVHGLFHKATSTLTYLITDPTSKQTIILDSVLDYDSASGVSSNTHNELVCQYITDHQLDVKYILESHVHADHLTGAQYLKQQYPDAQTGIGANVTTVQKTFAKIFNYTPEQLATDGSQFDLLFQDGDSFPLGDHTVSVIHTPGHTPACVCYVVGDAVFTGDTIFMPDFGTARCDFPGGSSDDLYASVRKLYDNLTDVTRVFVGNDYQPGGRELLFQSSIGEEKRSNKQLKGDTSGDEFAAWRSERDGQLGMPKLILPSLQVNLRNGAWPDAEENGVVYLKIPVNLLGKK
jgi:glyoxylase-like metal-dependent hydrolase (beta-lactamase superfamily II)